MDVEPFISSQPSVEDCWRGVILYGRNTASYKFALANALLELRPEAGQLLKLEDLAPIFATAISEHLVLAPRQITTTNGRFIQACLAYNEDRDLTKLVDATVSHGFANVIDAFHIVGSSPVHHRFYVDERKQHRGIRITDEFSLLFEGQQAHNLNQEVDARWRLVETAWNLGLAPHLLAVDHDETLGQLFALDAKRRRRSITGTHGALNGYQKGCCFYCGLGLRLDGSARNVDVDHFFPYRLRSTEPSVNLNGVWNLVLSCPRCNRGPKGKFDRIPSIRLLRRLFQRNEHLIDSHHPLRDTLIKQTGGSTAQRQAFLRTLYERVQLAPQNAWEPDEVFIDGV